MKKKLMLQGPLLLQYILGQIAIFVTAPVYFAAFWLMGYRVRDIMKVRKECARHFKSYEGPWIICANHLTMIDSLIISYATFSFRRHLMHYRELPWNLPERKNFQKNIVTAFLCYLCKCVPINRGGNREEMKKTLDKCTSLLEWRQPILIFPEGGRSRTGRVNTEGFSYGVGRFVKEFEECKVMCIYLRGDSQRTYSFIPKFGERFTVDIKVFEPEGTEENGLRAQRHYAEQIVKHIAQMETRYFDSHRQRYCGSDRSAEYGKESRYAIR